MDEAMQEVRPQLKEHDPSVRPNKERAIAMTTLQVAQ